MRHALAALALALAACDGPLLFAELSIPEIRVTLPGQSFPASDTTIPANFCDPTAPQSFPPCIALTLDYDLGGNVPVLTEQNVTYDLRLTDVAIALSATEVGKDLSGVRLVTIRVLDDPLDPTAGVVVASYVRPPGPVAPTAIAITGNANLDLGPYLEVGRLPVRVEVVLDAGTPAFLADVQVGFSLEVKLDWGAYL
jgi:hypothetical protein